MTNEEIRDVLKRIDGIWPPRKAVTHEARGEWVRLIKPLDGPVALRAIDALRESSPWRPSMADFRSAYWSAAAEPDDEVLALPAAPGAAPLHLEDIYGHRPDEWVYCWRCDQAISLLEQESMLYDGRRGVMHSECPHPGSAPATPTKLRLERDEYWRKARIERE